MAHFDKAFYNGSNDKMKDHSKTISQEFTFHVSQTQPTSVVKI